MSAPRGDFGRPASPTDSDRATAVDSDAAGRRLREALDDSVLMHTGRSIGDLASERVVDDVWHIVEDYTARALAPVRAVIEELDDMVSIYGWAAADRLRAAIGDNDTAAGQEKS